jgi:hypothetical protein
VCTVSWTPTADGYSVRFNRDERRTRGPGRPPAVIEREGVQFLAPTDADAGGTWIGVNHFGVTVGLLNRYHETPHDSAGSRTSRGLLVLSVLPAPTASDVVARLRVGDLRPFEPFTIVAVDRGGTVLLADWTGADLRTDATGQPGLIRTSSGRDQVEAERVRTAAFDALVPDRALPTPDDLDRFHRSHLPERGPFSVCMHRPEAETQSLTAIDLAGRSVRMTYFAGPPGHHPPATSRELPLTGPT